MITTLCSATTVTWALVFNTPLPTDPISPMMFAECYSQQADCDKAATAANIAFALAKSGGNARCVEQPQEQTDQHNAK